MPKFDIPIVVTVNCECFEEAQQVAYKAISPIDSETLAVSLANDELTTKNNERVVILHPSDVSNDYDEEEYRNNLQKKGRR